MPRKFPSLYNIIKKDDISTLTDFFTENPGYNEDTQLLTGKNLKLLEQAIDSNAVNCGYFLINRMQLTQLQSYTRYVVYNYKRSPSIFDHFINIATMLSERENNRNILFELVCEIIISHNLFTDEFIDRIVHSFPLINELNNIDKKRRFENNIIRSKIQMITFFEKYYREKNIDTHQLFMKCLLYSNSNPDNLLKIFKNINYTSKIIISNPYVYHDNNIDIEKKSKNEYSFEFLISICCNYKKFKTFELFKNNKFEEELMLFFSESQDILNDKIWEHANNAMFKILYFGRSHRWNNKIFTDKEQERMLKYLPYLSDTFFDYWKQNLISEKNKKNYYHDYFAEESQKLYDLLMEERKKL